MEGGVLTDHLFPIALQGISISEAVYDLSCNPRGESAALHHVVCHLRDLTQV